MSAHLKRKFLLSTVLIIFHLIGAIGTLIPDIRAVVVPFTPANLLISGLLLVALHQGSYKPLALYLFLVCSIGYGVEVLGIHTAFPFGSYRYGNTLGWKLLDVPLIIGVNWFLLSYSFGMLSAGLKCSQWIQWTLAALGMTLLDVIIEPSAIFLNYWSWAGGHIPLQNYIAWFFISFGMQVIFTRLLSRSSNPLSAALVVAQTLYFLILLIFINF